MITPVESLPKGLYRMIKSLVLPFGVSDRRSFLRLCSVLYFSQIILLVLGSNLIDFLKPDGESVGKLLSLLIGLLFVFIFPYLHVCAYAKHLKSVLYNRLWLIPITIILYCTISITGFFAVSLNSLSVFKFVREPYLMANLNLMLALAVIFSGYLIVSIGVAYLPERKPSPRAVDIV